MANTYTLDLNGSAYLKKTDEVGLRYDGSQNLTIEFWWSPDVVDGSNRTIVSKWDNPNSTVGDREYVFFHKNGLLYIYFRGSLAIAHDGSFTADTWYHVAITVDSSGNVYLYLNGNSTAVASGSSGTTTISDYSDFYIGANTGTNYYDGLVDDVRVYSVVRSGADIASDYDEELVGNEANLVAYYKFNNDATDETANGYDLSTGAGVPAYQSADLPFGGISDIVISDKYDTITISENITAYITEYFSENSDSVTLTEDISITIFDDNIDTSVADSISVLEGISLETLLTGINPTSINKKTVKIWQ